MRPPEKLNGTLGVVLVAALISACAGRHDLAAGPDDVRVRVANVGFDEDAQAHYVLLEDTSGRRGLQILVGDTEARSILFELHGVEPPRPLTQDLLRKVIVKTGHRVDRVVIGDLRDEVYYAEIYIDDGRYRIDSRPSDAIALAMGLKAPIFVASRLLQTAAFEAGRHGNLPASAHGLGLTVQALTPELAAYFALKPGAGVLVAEARGAAAQAGLKSGDIVTAVGPRPVKTPGDFAAAVARLSPGSPVALTVVRDGHSRVLSVETSAGASAAR